MSTHTHFSNYCMKPIRSKNKLRVLTLFTCILSSKVCPSQSVLNRLYSVPIDDHIVKKQNSLTWNFDQIYISSGPYGCLLKCKIHQWLFAIGRIHESANWMTTHLAFPRHFHYAFFLAQLIMLPFTINCAGW